MAYTPPAGDAADFTWLDAAAYTAPAGDAADFAFADASLPVSTYVLAVTPPAFPVQPEAAGLVLSAGVPGLVIEPMATALLGLSAFTPIIDKAVVTALLGLSVYSPQLNVVYVPAAIEFRHAPLIPWIMPMTSPVYPPGVTATLTNHTPGVSIRGLWSPADVLFGWSYDSGTDTISFPLASLFELTAAQADPATGDWRAILLAMSNTLWDAYIELDTAPQAMVLEYNPGYMMTAGPMVNTVKAEYTATVYLTFPEKFIADEP